MDVNRSETAGQAPEVVGRTPLTLTIAHSADKLSIETKADGRGEFVTYSFERRQELCLINTSLAVPTFAPRSS
jgi:hypothetical protein